MTTALRVLCVAAFLTGVSTRAEEPIPGTNSDAQPPIPEKDTKPSDKPAQADLRESVSVPAEAMAKTQTDGAAGGQAGIGFEYRRETKDSQFSVRARMNIAASRFEIVNGKPADYAAYVLQPDLRGASLALDTAVGGLLWNQRLAIGFAGGFRLSPTMTWVRETQDATGATQRVAHDAIVALLQVALTLQLQLPGPTPDQQVVCQLQLPLALHLLSGSVVAPGNADFLLSTLGTRNISFFAFAPKVVVRVGDFGLFAAMPLAVGTGWDERVPGLTGFNVILGAEVRGRVLEWGIPSGGGKTAKSGAGTDAQRTTGASNQLSL